MLQIYNTRADYNANHTAGVSLILSENAVMYDGQNVIKKYPNIGDFVVMINGKERFLDVNTATSELVNALPVIGKVYDVQGRYVRVVGGKNNSSEQWSNVCDFLLTPSSSVFDGTEHTMGVVLQNVVIGKFVYTAPSIGSPDDLLADFVHHLNSWLEENAPKWEAYVNSDNNAILQFSNYDGYESTCSIDECTLTKLVGSELAAETISYLKNENGQSFNYYQVMCYDRALNYFATNGSTPSTAIDNIQANTAPVTRSFFEDNPLGANLRAKFITYENYIAMCRAHSRELNYGIMQFRDGKAMTQKLLAKELLRWGVKECPYRAAVYANQYEAQYNNVAIEGYGAGDWWSPSMYELDLLMCNIRSDMLDPVNKNMDLIPRWSKINPTSNRWSCCRYYSNRAWTCNWNGVVDYGHFYSSFKVSAVTAFWIKD